MQPVQQKKKTSPWLYAGVGCGLLVLLGIGGTVAAVMFGASKLREMKEDMANPVTRTEKVKKVLGAQTLPDGYTAVMALSVPMILDSALLSTHSPDVPADHQKKEGERVFMYMYLKASTVKDSEALTAYMEGHSDDASVLERNNIRVKARELIGRGVFELDGQRRLLYLNQRGEMEAQEHKHGGSGLNSLVLFECPGQTQLRMGMWMAPDPSPQAPLEQLDLKGTPGDPEAVKAFMSHFNPCQEG
jgi:hypothetical protein